MANTDRYSPNRSDSLMWQLVQVAEYIAGMKRAQGTITFSGQPVDGETLTLGDGVNSVVFEFDDDSSVSGSNVLVTIGVTAEATLDNLVAAINAQIPTEADAQDPLKITATKASAVLINLRAEEVGTVQNVAIGGTPTNIAITGMTGGVDAGELDTELNVQSIQIGSVNLNDGSGTPITSTTIGAVQALDVNIAGGVTLEVNLDPDNDGVEIYGSDDGGTTQRVVKTDAQGELQVDILSSALPSGAATELTLAALNGKVTVCNTGAVTISASALPANAAQETGGNLATIAGAVSGGQVQVDVVAELPAGTQNIGSVNVAASALPANAAQETGGNLATMAAWNETGRAAVNIIAGQAGIAAGTGVDGAAVPRVSLATDVPLPAGTNAIGKLAANDGVDIGDVDVASIARTKKTPTSITEVVSTPGTAVPIAGGATEVVYFILEAKKASGPNAGVVYIGDSSVDKTANQQNRLVPGAKYEFSAPVGTKIDLQDLYIDADNAGDGVTGHILYA